jgi:hypothetical protein
MIPNAAKTAQPPTTPATIEIVFGFEALAAGVAVSAEEDSGDEVVDGREDSSAGCVAAPVVTGATTMEEAGGGVADAGADVADAGDVGESDVGDVDVGEPVDEEPALCGDVL